jgi:hypothetical protein
MTAVPLPSGWPNKAEWVDGEEDSANGNQGNLEEFFSRDLIHVNLLSVNMPGPLTSMVAQLTETLSSGGAC